MTTFKERLQQMKQELATDEEFAKANPGLQERLEKIEDALEEPKEEEEKSKAQKLEEYLIEDRLIKNKRKAKGEETEE